MPAGGQDAFSAPDPRPVQPGAWHYQAMGLGAGLEWAEATGVTQGVLPSLGRGLPPPRSVALEWGPQRRTASC